MQTTNKKKKGVIKLIAFVLRVLLIAALNHYYGWSDIFSGDDWYGNLQQMVKTNFLQAALIYIVLMVIASVVLAVPGVTFAIIAGAIFGPWWGTLLCVLSATLGAIAAFLAGRFFLQDSLRDQIVKNRYISRLLFDKSTKNEMMVLMITRLVPLFPYNLQNFAYGITDISLGKYSLGTFVFMIPGVAMYTVGTYALTGASNKLLYIGLTAAIVVAVMVLSKTLRKKYVPEEEASDEGAFSAVTATGCARREFPAGSCFRICGGCRCGTERWRRNHIPSCSRKRRITNSGITEMPRRGGCCSRAAISLRCFRRPIEKS